MRKTFLTNCDFCFGTTTKLYKREHGGQCKRCAEPGAVEVKVSDDTPTRNQRLLESGYQAYAREEGYFD